jgi:IMP dehydrogenase
MNKYIVEEALGYDDVMLIPKHSSIKSRANVDVSVELLKGIKLSSPIVPSNMKTIVGPKMIEKMYEHKMMSVMHRFISIDEQIKIGQDLLKKHGKDIFNYLGYSIGVKEDDYKNLSRIIDLGVKIIVVDVAHGHSDNCGDMTKYIANTYPEVLLIAGNTATYDGAMFLYECGANIVKCNVGSGSICLTRINTGNGIPAITTLIDSVKAKHDFEKKSGKKVFLMSDGGVKVPGDLVKGLCFADLMMCGNIFSGSDETPTDDIIIDGKSYKSYAGSSTHRGNYSEGVSALVEAKGPVEKIITNFTEGLRSGMSYQGANDLLRLKDSPQFVKITQAGMVESNAHNVILKN